MLAIKTRREARQKAAGPIRDGFHPLANGVLVICHKRLKDHVLIVQLI